MFCTNCGKQIPDDARFCPECGAQTEPPLLIKQIHIASKIKVITIISK